jgi:signal transduction histidine kinase
MTEAPYPELVRDVFLVEVRGKEVVLSALRPQTGRFEPSPWPAELTSLRRNLVEVAVVPPAGEPFSGDRMELPLAPEIPGLVIPVSFFGPPSPPDGQPGSPERHGTRNDLLVVRLDRGTITNEILPALTRRYFGNARDADYELAIFASPTPENEARAPGKMIYRSDPALPASVFRSADVRLGMFELRPFEELRGIWPGHRSSTETAHRPDHPERHRAWRLPLTLNFERQGGAWTFVARHRHGSLEQAVGRIRLHNMSVSLGILLLLTVTIGMLVAATQRAQKLARQQIEFVAGVSHELHTPLTAIRAAGQNLADGVVADPAQVRRYGSLIEKEGRRLSNTVAQVLEFAGIQSSRKIYTLRPVDVENVIDGALDDSRWMLQEKGAKVEKEVELDLPPVLADATALRRAVQNLIENAAKYGAGSGAAWIGVQARRAASGNGVEITVADHGPGIRREDVPHLFEPFYRGREVAASSIPGSGLGLSVVRHIVGAHRGKVTVATTATGPGRGSAFTLHLPGAPEEAM